MVPLSIAEALPVDPALATVGGCASPVLRPVPVRGVMPQPAMNSPAAVSAVRVLRKNVSCPACGKTGLRATSLKRHLRTHSGDRPYKCDLCHNTFTRSDTRNWHFQRCSVRHGNPTGASHAPHP
ncbi:hypothetical protein MYCTH_2310773 [Thermothelomyces thermophilus ATCC 42464]|uniref:C2H2-type domain-containing protein n=1 Tax=Thermothelomyces thermophilus (strain ATCC 42464 / BCRC 31852 / DSM 1799) TaxID=573729 RepID=G2QM17_THET4|nr:uncharacterized protein MYCTH_2310773 [Thermothelomyces thermophilus ATCC 42464]AEO60997.1 hypothetical protein MYCTH_2310773 [Thermothelomyces thermophilus ATCC 42464]